MAMKVGLVGCGNISDIYFANARRFSTFDIVACADLDPGVAAAKSAAYGARPLGVAELLADPAVEIVLNLTPPKVHAEISLAAIENGKHVYTEKPLATSLAPAVELLDRAQRAGLRVGAAPDTVLGANLQSAARMLDAGGLGAVVFGTSGMLSHGMEHWHPNPQFFYADGGGPVMDMGPYYVAALVTLLGPVERVQAVGRIGSPMRTITAAGSRHQGETIQPSVLTTVVGTLVFTSGVHVSLVVSWDAWAHRHPVMELHAVNGSMGLADPNWFGGPLQVAAAGEGWREVATDECVFGRPNFDAAGVPVANYRGLGLAEMCRAIERGTPHRVSGEMALHVLEVLLALNRCALLGTSAAIPQCSFTPPRLPEDEASALWAGGASAAVD